MLRRIRVVQKLPGQRFEEELLCEEWNHAHAEIPVHRMPPGGFIQTTTFWAVGLRESGCWAKSIPGVPHRAAAADGGGWVDKTAALFQIEVIHHRHQTCELWLEVLTGDIYALGIPISAPVGHGFILIFAGDTVLGVGHRKEGVQVYCAGFADGQVFHQLVDAPLGQAGLPLARLADVVALFAVPDAALQQAAVTVLHDQVFIDILLPERAVFVGIGHVDMEADHRVVLLRLLHQPEDAGVCIGVLRAFEFSVRLEEGWVFGVMAFILPAHEVDDLLDSAGDLPELPDAVQRLIECHVYPAGFGCEERLVGHALMVLVNRLWHLSVSLG